MLRKNRAKYSTFKSKNQNKWTPFRCMVFHHCLQLKDIWFHSYLCSSIEIKCFMLLSFRSYILSYRWIFYLIRFWLCIHNCYYGYLVTRINSQIYSNARSTEPLFSWAIVFFLFFLFLFCFCCCFYFMLPNTHKYPKARMKTCDF